MKDGGSPQPALVDARGSHSRNVRIMTRVKPWVVALLCVAGLSLPLGVLDRSGDAGFGPVAFLLTGRAFVDRPIVTGGALDQFSLQKELFLLGYSLVVLCPFLVLVRWLGRSLPTLPRRILAGVSLIALLHPFSVLTIFFWDVSRYAGHMGVTTMRLTGLAVAVAAYASLAAFAAWLAGSMIGRAAKPIGATP